MKPSKQLATPLAIVGMGISGESVKKLVTALGYAPEAILTFDTKAGVAQYDDPQKLLSAGPRTLVVSPGVPLATPWIQEALATGIALTSELEIAYSFLTSERVVGVTGSVGKSTTVATLEAGLKAFSPQSFVGGNIGKPLADYAWELVTQARTQPAPFVVLELSSYQLENFASLQCEFSAFTYLTANHLERYKSQEEYYQTKWRLVEKTRGTAIFNKHGGDLRTFVRKQAKPRSQQQWADREDIWFQSFKPARAKLLGGHNQDNLALAFSLAKLMHWPKEAYEAMLNFGGLSHRVENLGEFSGIRFVDDSKATTMESVKTAVSGVLESVASGRALHLLLGGKDKNLPWGELHSLATQKALRFYFFGECGEKAKMHSSLSGAVVEKFADVFPLLKQNVQVGDTVLLSPGGTSWDEFKDFEERGHKFAELVSKTFG